ncbi:MAG: hypothetical protein ACM3X9_15425 [Bacillota bacterium]
MKWLKWGLQLLIPLVVLYTIGYYVPGFSALTVSWVIGLSVLIFMGELLVELTLGKVSNRLGVAILGFLVSTAVLFTVTLAIEGGHVPLGGALLAAAIIAVLTAFVNPVNAKLK